MSEITITEAVLRELKLRRRDGTLPKELEKQLTAFAVPQWFNYVAVGFGLYFLLSSISNYIIGNVAVSIAALGPAMASIAVAIVVGLWKRK